MMITLVNFTILINGQGMGCDHSFRVAWGVGLIHLDSDYSPLVSAIDSYAMKSPTH
jgi:hypothetical protein